MDIGTAIKTIRKRKGITAKELSIMIEISANALCSIETNNSFPSKATIKKICKALNIPPAYLLFFSITDEDLPTESQALFNALYKPLKEALLKDINTNK